jgi:hypothetical protein
MRRAFEEVTRKIHTQDEEAHVGLLISNSAPHVIMEVRDVVYPSECQNEHRILQGDVLVAVDCYPVVHVTAKRLHSLLAGEPYSHVRLTLSRETSDLEEGLEYAVTLGRHLSEQHMPVEDCELVESDSLEDAAPVSPAESSHLAALERARAHAVELMMRPCAQASALNVVARPGGAMTSTIAHLAWHEPAYEQDRCKEDPRRVLASHREGGRDCSARRIAKEIDLMRGGT